MLTGYIVMGALLVIGLIGIGIFLKKKQKDMPKKKATWIFGGSIASSLLIIFGLGIGLVPMMTNTLHAQDHAETVEAAEATTTTTTNPNGGLAFIAAALAVGLGSIGAAIAVGMSASAAVGAISENQQVFGQTLVFVGLAEGIAIYGLIIAILILNKV